MRKLLFVLASVFFVSCAWNLKPTSEIPQLMDSIQVLNERLSHAVDCVIIEDIQADHLFQILAMKDTNSILMDSISVLNHDLLVERSSVSYAEFQGQFILEKIRRYVLICESNPTNKKFFFGWIRRAVEKK